MSGSARPQAARNRPAADFSATDLSATDSSATDTPAEDLPAADLPAADLPATDLHVVERGEGGPALVFLHYFGGSSIAWEPVIDGLASRHRCLAPDLRGFGRSPAPPAGWTVDRAAADIAALIGERGVEEFLLVGHSMGGKIALALAARRAAGLRGLVLLAPSPPTPEPIEEDERAKSLRSHGLRAEAEATLRKITHRPLDRSAFEACVDDALRASPAAWSWWLTQGSCEDLTGSVGLLPLASLVLVGSDDPALSAAVMTREVMPALTGARLIVLPGAGHLLPLEAAEEVAGHIAAFAADR